MDIQYIPYSDKYYKELKKITITSFELTSFNTDRHIPPKKAKQIAWELWCKPVITSDKKKYCIIALGDNKVLGYVIYGANLNFSKILKLRIGTIILMAVNKKHQGKYHIASNLLKTILNIYQNFQMDMITVGTDVNNLPAFINYINNGFRPILLWTTFRYYFENKLKSPHGISIMPFKNIRPVQLKNFSRPVPLLRDKKMSSEKKIILKAHIIKKITESIKNKKNELYEFKYKKKSIGYFTIIKEEIISKVLKKEVYHINDIIYMNNDIKLKKQAIINFLFYLQKRFKKIFIVEIFTESDNWDLIEILTSAGFIPLHHTITLHKHINF